MSDSLYDDLVPSNETTAPKPKENYMNGKSVLKSKTMWVNVFSAITAIIATLGGSDIIQQNPQVAGYAATALAIANVILRLMTKVPVSIR